MTAPVFVKLELACVDCAAEFPGAINVNSNGGAGVAWLCPPCREKYPSSEAVSSRVVDVSTRRRAEFKAPGHP